jgi:gliding motility associated protien GldN
MVSILKRIVIVAVLALSITSASAQVFTPGQYRDGIYDKDNTINRKFIPYTYLREGDVQWSKRVWREIDMREKINHPLYFPIEPVNGRISLFQLLAKSILAERIIAFKDDEFLIPLQLAEVKDQLMDCDSVAEVSVDADGNPVTTTTFRCDSTSIYKKIKKFRLKEDWFFDKQKSVMEVRILGICAVTFIEKDDDEIDKDMFWVYFPECRPVFAENEVYNTKNDAERRSFDDLFWKRQFNSNIVKESNVYERGMAEYAKGIDALLENDRVKKQIFEYEHDFWHF